MNETTFDIQIRVIEPIWAVQRDNILSTLYDINGIAAVETEDTSTRFITIRVKVRFATPADCQLIHSTIMDRVQTVNGIVVVGMNYDARAMFGQ